MQANIDLIQTIAYSRGKKRKRIIPADGYPEDHLNLYKKFGTELEVDKEDKYMDLTKRRVMSNTYI